MKKLLCTLTALAVFTCSTVLAAKIDTLEVDMENMNFTVSGSLEKSGMGSYKVMYNSNGTEYYENVGQFDTDENGMFTLTVPVTNTDKDFTIYLVGETLTEDKTFKTFYFPDINEFESYAQKLIDGEISIKDVLADDELSRKILVDTTDYKKIKNTSDVINGLNAYLDGDSASVENWNEFVNLFNSLCAINLIGQAGNASQVATLLENYAGYVKLSDAAAYATYTADYFKDGYADAVLATLTGDTYASLEEFYNKFNDGVILKGVHMVSNWAFASKPIAENSGYVKDADVSGYNALKSYKGEVDKLIANKSYENVELLVSAFNGAVKTVREDHANDKPASGGGSGGGGGAGISGINSTISETSENKVTNQVVQELGFSDIANVQWASNAILTLCNKGIINGYEDNTFKPNSSITREEFVKIVISAFGYETATDAENTFADLSSANWAYPYIMTAVDNGVINGVSDTEFGMGKKITRQEMAVILYRAVTNKGYNISGGAKTDFTDRDNISVWAVDAVENMARGGVISGFTDGSFKPAENSTRAQAAVMVYNTLANIGLL